MSTDSSIDTLRENIKNGYTPIRGVNLGGWLVAEHYMTKGSPAWHDVPDHIADKGEFKTMQFLGHDKGDKQFRQHRDTFITEQDFRDIAANKMNTVRIPVGYWITEFDNSGGGDPNGWRVFAPGAIAYLDRAIREWAPRNNLLVLLSFHAAKGSQNGNDHSAPADPGKSHWGHYPENVQNTLDAVEWLGRRYNNDPAFLGICLLNEPFVTCHSIPSYVCYRHDTLLIGTTNENVLKQYYHNAVGRIRQFSSCLLMVSPRLDKQGPDDSDWKHFMPPPAFHGIRHEWHPYLVWGYEGWDKNRLIAYAENDLKNNIEAWKGNWLFIGEWSIASSPDFDNDDDWCRFAKAQLDAFNKAHGGWTYWTWRFYNDNDQKNAWSMKAMIKRGLLQF